MTALQLAKAEFLESENVEKAVELGNQHIEDKYDWYELIIYKYLSYPDLKQVNERAYGTIAISCSSIYWKNTFN